MVSGYILELKPEFFEYFTRIETKYSSKIETKPDLILERITLVSLLYLIK